MAANKKEYRELLTEQLTLLQRLEQHAKDGNLNVVREEIRFERRAIERKLQQLPEE